MGQNLLPNFFSRTIYPSLIDTPLTKNFATNKSIPWPFIYIVLNLPIARMCVQKLRGLLFSSCHNLPLLLL
jgi:hypothetical protein